MVRYHFGMDSKDGKEIVTVWAWEAHSATSVTRELRMSNDAKLGIILGIAVVIACGIIFFRQPSPPPTGGTPEVPEARAAVGERTSSPTSAPLTPEAR